jgi:hypothetical protein
MRLADLLSRLDNVKRSGNGHTARCPSHSDRENSLSIAEGENGALLLMCFAGCAIEAICATLGITIKDLFPSRREDHPTRLYRFRPSAANPKLAPDNAMRRKLARSIWREAKPANGTTVETYLRTRGITVPVPPTLRFHPSLKHPSGTYLPAMVAAVEHVRSGNDVIAVHRTYLASQAKKPASSP